MGKSKRRQQADVRTASEKPRFWWMEWSILSGLVTGTFLLRVLGQLDKVFVGDLVIFRGTDAWYHMRLADNFAANFPRFLLFDPYLVYPDGSPVGFNPLLNGIIGTAGKLGLNYEMVGAFIPPILGALILVPIYFIGKKLFSREVGIFACVLVAILPTELFHRSLLGFTDHHVVEAFLMLTTIALIIYALDTRRSLFSILAGVSLGLYCLAWHGNLFFIFILLVWFLVQFLYDYYRKVPVDFLCKTLVIVMSLSFIMLLPYLLVKGSPREYILVPIVAILIPIGLYLSSKYMQRRESVFLLLSGLLVGGFFIGSIVYPSILHFGVDALRTIFLGVGSPIAETVNLTPQVAVNQYGLSFLFAVGGLVYLIWKRQSPLFIIWSLFLLGATIGQRKWGYYYAADLALLTSFLVFEVSKQVKPTIKWAVVILLCVFLVIPSLRGTIGISNLPNNISPSWYATCTWLRDNTPNQFEEDNYLSLDSTSTPNYGILSWWDYGHWIIRIGERVPTSNPANWGARGSYMFFVSQSLEEAESWLEDLNIRYVLVDQEMLTGKFPTIARVSGYEGDFSVILQNSMAYKLYTSDVEGYTLVHQEGGVKVFERQDWNN